MLVDPSGSGFDGQYAQAHLLSSADALLARFVTNVTAVGVYEGQERSITSSTTDGRPHLFVFTQKAGSVEIWKDQTRLHTADGTPTANTGIASKVVLGRDSGNGSITGIKIYLAGLYQGAFPDALIGQIARNPWQLFAPLPRRIWVPSSAGAAAYSLSAAQGSYTLTGQAAALRAARNVAAAQGSYALTGQAAALKAARRIAAGQGAYALTGQAASLAAARAVAAAQGAYVLTGQASGILFGRKLAAAQGAYTLSGQQAQLVVARTLGAAQGAYALAGQEAVLTYSGSGVRTLVAGAGSYALTGQEATLRRTATLAAAQGAYALTGQAATLGRGQAFAAASGSYALTGQAVLFGRTYVMSAGAGAYTLTGQVALLGYSAAVVVVYSTGRSSLATPGPQRLAQESGRSRSRQGSSRFRP
jgi:hypothetical protein